MAQRARIATAILAFTLISVMLWQIRSAREPLYHGKPVSYWINHWGDIYAPWNVEHPDYERGPLGWLPGADSNAIPFLVEALERGNGLLGGAYPRLWLASPAWVRARLPRPIIAGLVRVNAAFALAGLGPASKPAVPAFLWALGHTRSRAERGSIAVALGQIGKREPTVRALLKQALEDKCPAVRSGAARALAVIGPPAGDAVPALVKCLEDSDLDTRISATNALSEMAQAARQK